MVNWLNWRWGGCFFRLINHWVAETFSFRILKPLHASESPQLLTNLAITAHFSFPAQLTHSIKTSWKTEFQICWRCSIKLHFWELDSKKLFQEMISYTLAAALLQGKDEVVQIQSSIQTFFIAFLHIYNKTWSYSMRNLRVLNLSLESCNYTDVH